MNKTTISGILVFLIMIISVNADILTFTSGGGNELVILPFSEGEIGFFTQIPTIVIPIEEEAPAGGGGSGQVEEQFIEIVKEGCPEGQLMWNEDCYNCTGQLIQIGNDIKCAFCEEGFYDINTDTCITDFELSPFFTIAVFILVIGGFIAGRYTIKERKKRVKEQEKVIEERRKKAKENERRMV